MLLDNGPAHTRGLEEDLVKELILFMFIFSHLTNLILQPINQRVISDFRQLYTKACFGSVKERRKC